MNIARGLAAIALIAAAGAPARADELLATRRQPLDEISHTVAVRIADGVATYTVQRQFHNRGKVADEARLAIELPTGAAATGLRIRARGTWYAGELLDHEVAAARYRELTGAGVHDARDPALLFWISSSELYLQVFPVLPGAVNTVEYTLTVPARYAAGRYWLTYPRVDPAAARPSSEGRLRGDPAAPAPRKLVDPVVTVLPGWTPPPGGLVVDGKPIEPGTPVALAPRGRNPWQIRRAAGDGGDGGGGDGYDLDLHSDAHLPYAASVLEIPASREAQLRHTLVKLRVELQHPDPSDLQLALVTPAGQLVDVVDEDGDPLDTRAVLDLRLPEPARAAGRWRLLVRNQAKDAGAIVRWALAFGDRTFASADAPIFIPGEHEAQGLAVLGVAAPPRIPWTGRLGRVVASDAHAFARLELDAAPRLSAVPARAQVVFVLDASHSAAGLRDAQLAILRAYLAHVPDAELEVIAVRRRATRVLGRFVPAREAPALLDAAVRAGALAPGNGSALDDGARLAAAVLAGRPGPHRVVLATDELLRPALTDAAALAALAALAPAAVVHVVVPSTDGLGPLPGLERDDAGMLAALAAGHHGILARISGVPAKAADLEPVVLELVRPTRIDQLAIAGASPLGLPATLAEGEGIRLFESDLTAAAAPQAISLTGKLWSDPIRLELTASPAFSAATAAFVFGADRYFELSDDEQRTVAMAARAVSPVTSYLAIEPGVRPSKIGLDDEGGGVGGMRGFSVSGSTACGVGSLPTFIVEKPDLTSLIPTAACVRQHAARGADWAVKLVVETTKDEIVDVQIADGAGPLAACLAEAAWSVRLPSFYDQDRDRYTVDLSAP